MGERLKNAAVTAVFLIFIFALAIISALKPDDEISVSERRKLEQLPALSAENISDTSFMQDFEKYKLDQFPIRDNFRQLKAAIQYNILMQKDNNSIYVADGSASKMEYPLNENSVINAADKLNAIYNKYLKSNDSIFYSIIPDKNYFLADGNDYLSLDYNKVRELMRKNVKNMTYIDIFDCLTAEDFYLTDSHWRQEKLGKVTAKISGAMDFSDRISGKYEMERFYQFYGVYYGQSALPLKAEAMYYLINDTLSKCTVYNYETGETTGIYNTEKLDGYDPYDVFLSGAAALIEIENTHTQAHGELIVFRDSFGSSLVPLLCEAYSKTTVVDLRYISSEILSDYINFENQDVLFLYSVPVLNNSQMLK